MTTENPVVRHLNGVPADDTLEDLPVDDDAIDHIASAEHVLMHSDCLDDPEQRLEWIQTAQAHALIAIAERLDCIAHGGH